MRVCGANKLEARHSAAGEEKNPQVLEAAFLPSPGSEGFACLIEARAGGGDWLH